MTESALDRWLGDDPRESVASADAYDRESFVSRLTGIVVRMATASPSSVSALIGPWGSGKTSVLDSAVTRLRARQWYIVRFNPWMYADPVALHAGFFAELRSALPKKRRWNGVRQSLVKWGRRAAPLAAALHLAGYDAREVLGQSLTLLESSAAAQLANVEKAMKTLDKPVLMVVDDLDRLGADELLQVFKLVRLVGRLPNVHYMLSYDERTLIDLLGKTDLVAAGDERRALDYLEKIVQVRFDLPLLRQYQVDEVVSRSLDILLHEHTFEFPVDEKARIRRMFETHLSSRLHTPRTLHRFFAQLSVFLEGMSDEVRLDDFIQLMWLRVIEPGVYAVLPRYKNDLLGIARDADRAHVDDDGTLIPDQERWLQRLRSAHVADDNLHDVLWVVRTMFPSMHGFGEVERTPMSRPVADTPSYLMRAISHPGYFDRYFAYAVPKEDISDSDVREFFVALQSQNPVDHQRFPLELLLRKLQYLIALPDIASQEVLYWLARRYQECEPFDVMSSLIQSVATTVVEKLDPAVVRDAGHQIAGGDTDLYLLTVVHRNLSGAGGLGPDDDARADALRYGILEKLRGSHDRLRELSNTPLNASWFLLLAFGNWYEIDPAGYTDAVTGAVNSGRWSALDVMAAMVSPMRSALGDWRIGKYSSLGPAVEMLDLHALAAQYAKEIAALEPLPQELNVLATHDNLRRYVLGLLRGY